MKTVMVTGASGMIGLALTETLLEKGFKVIGTDSKPNDFVNSPNYSFVQASIDDKSSITNILNGSSIDALVHLACSCDNDFPPIITSAEEKMSSAVDKYLYKAAVDAGVGDIILLSTYQVYALVRHKIKIPCITFFYIHLPFCRFIFKACLVFASFKDNIIYIHNDYITIQKFCLYKSSTSSCKLIKN